MVSFAPVLLHYGTDEEVKNLIAEISKENPEVADVLDGVRLDSSGQKMEELCDKLNNIDIHIPDIRIVLVAMRLRSFPKVNPTLADALLSFAKYAQHRL